jgi:diguanylate cyclase (GGDEF)-like protein
MISFHDVSAYVVQADLEARDALTGLFNRAGFQAHIRQMLQAAAGDGGTVSLLCLDLDRFKSVNDTLGHPVGDALLVKVAERLRRAARKQDIIARMGGDEFAIIQDGAGQPNGAQSLAARLIDLLGRTYVISGHSLHIGASIGIATAPLDGNDADTLIKRADLALYRAKAEGRGQYRTFAADMDTLVQQRRQLEVDLRKAMALREFELAFQPQVRAATRELLGFEALLRWRSPTRGLVAPSDFIPLAEEMGLIVPLGDWVLRCACHVAARWRAPLSVSVNMSEPQLRNPRLAESVRAALDSAQLDAGRLELEITEGALLKDTQAVLAALNALKAMGVRVTMDDFGTGYSSLTFLQKFPFDRIKIDKSFVRRMAQDKDSQAIVRAIAALGASLGMATTAEGVETAEQLATVQAEGCTDVQGHLTGAPMTSDDAAFLAAGAIPLPALLEPALLEPALLETAHAE